jgi:hypothetical protein
MKIEVGDIVKCSNNMWFSGYDEKIDDMRFNNAYDTINCIGTVTKVFEWSFGGVPEKCCIVRIDNISITKSCCDLIIIKKGRQSKLERILK